MTDEETFTSAYIGNAYFVWKVNIQILTMNPNDKICSHYWFDILIRYNENYVMTICWSKVQGCCKWHWKEDLAT